MKIKPKDTIKVLTGKDKGRQGIVAKLMPKNNNAIVTGINMVKKHLKPTQGKPGGIIDKEAPIYLSKLALICPKCKKATRVGYRFENSKKIRFCKKCQTAIDLPVKIAKKVKSVKLTTKK